MDQLTPLTISFAKSLGSNHAALYTTWYPAGSFAHLPHDTLPSFMVDDVLKEQWCLAFRKKEIPTITNIETLEATAEQFRRDVDNTCASLFPRRHVPDPQGVQWWNAECSAAVSLVKAADPGKPTSDAVYHLCRTITKAKHSWAEEFLSHTSQEHLWIAAKWHKGRRSQCIPPILTEEGLSTDTSSCAAAFRTKFFPPPLTTVQASQPDDPPLVQAQAFVDVTLDEVRDGLQGTSNASTLGRSGIRYKMLKWAFEASPSYLTELLRASL